MKTPVNDLTADEVRERFDYCKRTGVLTRRIQMGPQKAGAKVTNINAQGYVTVSIKNKKYLAHRIIWLWVTGEWPENWVDHRNGKRHDNRWRNLRQADCAYNNQNRTRSWGKVGMLGVVAAGRKFAAQITVNGRSRRLGTFPTAEAAHMAYIAAKQIHHPHAHIVR